MDTFVGDRLHQLMWRSRISQTAFAPQIGLTQGGLSKKLRGERGWTLDELKDAARVLDTTVAYLMGETENPHPENPDGGSEPMVSTVKSRQFGGAEVIDMFGRMAV